MPKFSELLSGHGVSAARMKTRPTGENALGENGPLPISAQKELTRAQTLACFAAVSAIKQTIGRPLGLLSIVLVTTSGCSETDLVFGVEESGTTLETMAMEGSVLGTSDSSTSTSSASTDTLASAGVDVSSSGASTSSDSDGSTAGSHTSDASDMSTGSSVSSSDATGSDDATTSSDSNDSDDSDAGDDSVIPDDDDVCADEFLICGDLCIDPAGSELHCGASGSCTGSQAGVECEVGESCIAGKCEARELGWADSKVLVDEFSPTGRSPFAVTLEDGTLLVVWTEQAGVFTMMADASGHWGEVQRIGDPAPDLAGLGFVAASPGPKKRGQLVWREGDALMARTVERELDAPSALVWSSPVVLREGLPQKALPVFAGVRDRGAVVAWLEARDHDDASRATLELIELSPTGGHTRRVWAVDDVAEKLPYLRAQMAADASAVVAWISQSGSDSMHGGIEAIVRRPDNTRWYQQNIVRHGETIMDFAITISPQALGHVAWTDDDGREIVVQRSNEGASDWQLRRSIPASHRAKHIGLTHDPKSDEIWLTFARRRADSTRTSALMLAQTQTWSREWQVAVFPCLTGGHKFRRPLPVQIIDERFIGLSWTGNTPMPKAKSLHRYAWSPRGEGRQHCDDTTGTTGTFAGFVTTEVDGELGRAIYVTGKSGYPPKPGELHARSLVELR